MVIQERQWLQVDIRKRALYEPVVPLHVKTITYLARLGKRLDPSNDEDSNDRHRGLHTTDYWNRAAALVNFPRRLSTVRTRSYVFFPFFSKTQQTIYTAMGTINQSTSYASVKAERWMYIPAHSGHLSRAPVTDVIFRWVSFAPNHSRRCTSWSPHLSTMV